MCDDDDFGSSIDYALCVMMISLKVWKLTQCVMMISSEVWKFGSLHSVCDDDKFGRLEVYTLGVVVIRLEHGPEV